jgi:dUTP pyrophosphatase
MDNNFVPPGSDFPTDPKCSIPDQFYVQKLVPEAKLPTRGTPYSAGLDLHVLNGGYIEPGETIRFGTGLAFAIPEGFEGHIHPRSSTFFKGMDLDGLIDSDYRGEVLLQIRNASKETIYLDPGQKVAQLVIRRVAWFSAVEAPALPLTARGAGGFGSTGR